MSLFAFRVLVAASLALFACPALAQDAPEAPADSAPGSDARVEPREEPPIPDSVLAEAPSARLVLTPTPAPLSEANCPEGLECRVGPDGLVHAYQRVSVHRMNTGLVIAGAVMLGGAWLLNLAGSALGTIWLSFEPTARPGDYFAWSLVPLVGPIAQMFQLGDEHWQVPILAVIETIEVVGLIIAAVGTAGEDVVMLEPVAGMMLTPWASSTGGGAVLTGVF